MPDNTTEVESFWRSVAARASAELAGHERLVGWKIAVGLYRTHKERRSLEGQCRTLSDLIFGPFLCGHVDRNSGQFVIHVDAKDMGNADQVRRWCYRLRLSDADPEGVAAKWIVDAIAEYKRIGNVGAREIPHPA